MLSNTDILKIKILKNSHASEWNQARLEWEILQVYITDKPQKCLCGHFPIKRVCELVNKRTGAIEHVGSCCATKFLETNPDLIYRSIQKLLKNINVTLSAEVIEMALKAKVISPVERYFYLASQNNRKFKAYVLVVNQKFLDYFYSDKLPQ